MHNITAGVTMYEDKETFTKGRFTGQNELIFCLLAIVIASIIGVTSSLSPSFNCALISALTIAGLVLAYDPQFIRKAIISVPLTVTFIYTLPSNLNPVWRIAAIAIYTVVIIGLMLKVDFHKLHFVMKIPFVIIKIVFHTVRAVSVIVNSVIIPMLSTARTIITTVIIPLIKKTAIIIFTVVVPIFISSLMLRLNISVTIALRVQIGAMVLTFLSSHLRNEVYCAIAITATSTLLIFVGDRPTWYRMDDHDFNMMMIASAFLLIILICIGLLSDLQFLQKVGLIVVIMNVTIITIDLLLTPTNSFSTHDQPLFTTTMKIIFALFILQLAHNYEVIIYILILAALIVCMYFIFV